MDNVFEGEAAISRFLDPGEQPPLPLVEIPPSCNPFSKSGVRIFAKMMGFLPLGNVKSLPALSMLRTASAAGLLDGVDTLVECSSGNTVFSEAVIGKSLGIGRTIAYASNEVEPGKLQMLRLFGTHIRIVEEGICPDPGDPESAINQARRLGKQPGYFNPDQYGNGANPEAHRLWTGPQIWLQRPDTTLVCAGLGTTGTLCGTSSYLKERNPNIKSVGVVRVPNNPVPGVRTRNLLREIDFPWRAWADAVEEIGTRESYERSALLCQQGLAVGPSSGFAFAGLLSFLARREKEQALDALRNENGQIVAVCICPDTPFPYLDEYFRYLGEEFFPPIENRHLLKRPLPKEEAEEASGDVEISASVLIESAYGKEPDALWNDLQGAAAEEEVMVREGVLILDLRSRREFSDHHLPGSLRIEAESFTAGWDIFERALLRQKRRVVFVCRYGVQSAYLAGKARKAGIDAWSLSGGTVEWSRLGLPRVMNAACISRQGKEAQ